MRGGHVVVGPAVVSVGKWCIYGPLPVHAPPPLFPGSPGSSEAPEQRKHATVGLRVRMKGTVVIFLQNIKGYTITPTCQTCMLI